MNVQLLIQVTPEAKMKAAEAKSRGHDAFNQKDYHMAVDSYTQVTLFVCFSVLL